MSTDATHYLQRIGKAYLWQAELAREFRCVVPPARGNPPQKEPSEFGVARLEMIRLFLQSRHACNQFRTPPSRQTVLASTTHQEFLEAQAKEAEIECERAFQATRSFSHALLGIAQKTSETITDVALEALQASGTSAGPRRDEWPMQHHLSHNFLRPGPQHHRPPDSTSDLQNMRIRIAALQELQETFHKLHTEHCALFSAPPYPQTPFLSYSLQLQEALTGAPIEEAPPSTAMGSSSKAPEERIGSASPAAECGAHMVHLYKRLLALQDQARDYPTAFSQSELPPHVLQTMQELFSTLDTEFCAIRSYAEHSQELREMISDQFSSCIEKPLSTLRETLKSATRALLRTWKNEQQEAIAQATIRCSRLHSEESCPKEQIETLLAFIQHTKNSLLGTLQNIEQRGFLEYQGCRILIGNPKNFANSWQHAMTGLIAIERYCQERWNSAPHTVQSQEKTPIMTKRRPAK